MRTLTWCDGEMMDGEATGRHIRHPPSTIDESLYFRFLQAYARRPNTPVASNTSAAGSGTAL
jgi:hypothetical protein